MREYTVKEIADIVGGELIAGDGGVKITGFSTNSKEGDAATMFVPVIGERVDAHGFIGDAYAHGMRATFTCRRDVAPPQDAGAREARQEEIAARQAGEKETAAKKGQILLPDGQADGQTGVPDGMAYVYINLPGEKNPNVTALQRFGAHVRNTFSLPVVGITGSVGKTTTKEMVAAALETGLCTLKTAGNMNSQVGLPRMMCRLEKKHEIAVIEMGMSMLGEMGRIVRVARPECAVMTNIGVSHIGQLGSKENIRREKLNIINEFPDGGVLFLNADDPMLREVADAWRAVCKEGSFGAASPFGAAHGEKNGAVLHAAQTEENRGAGGKEGQSFAAAEAVRAGKPEKGGVISVCGVAMSAATAERFPEIRVVTFGTGADCDYRAKDIRVVEERMQFTLLRGQQEGIAVRLSVAGEHNVLNALAAFAVAEHYGIAPEQAADGLFSYHPLAMRGGRIQAGGVTLLDDTYNASPDSMKGGIDSLMAVKAKRHIAVLADMLELGGISRECHEQVGRYAAARGVDCIVAVGGQARYYLSAAFTAEEPEFGKPAHPAQGALFADNAAALTFLKGFVEDGDAVLLKGSRGMKLEELVAGLSGKA